MLSRRVSLLALLPFVAACTAHQPLLVSSASLGPGQEEVVGVVSGHGGKIYIPLLGGVAPFGIGDDSFKAALNDALKKVPAHTLVNVFADQQCTFFPHPLLYFWASCETILTGTAVRYTALPLPKNDPRCL